MAINNKQCINCGSKNTVPIIYGMPSSAALEEEQAGKVKLGGCVVSIDDPQYFCNDCAFKWGPREAEVYAYDNIRRLKARVGGFHEGYYEMTIDFTSHELVWNYSMEEEEVRKRLRSKTVERVKNELLLVNLLHWKRQYHDRRVLDGTHWEVEIYRDGKKLVKSGSNAFPNEWVAFCRVMARVSGMRFR